MAADCEKDIRDSADTAVNCPSGTDLIMFVPQSGPVVFRTYDKVKECLGVTYKYASFNVTANSDGSGGNPVDGSNTYQNNRFIGATDFTHIIVNGFTEQGDLYFELDNVSGTLTRVNQWSRGDVGTFCFNELI